VGTHGTGNALFITNLHEMVTSLERVPDLEPFRQQRRWVMEAHDLELEKMKSQHDRPGPECADRISLTLMEF